MPFPESKRAKKKRYYFDHHHCGRSACTVQRSIIDLSGICSLYRLKAAPQIQNFFPSKSTVTRYKNIENVMLYLVIYLFGTIIRVQKCLRWHYNITAYSYGIF